jgi:transposase
MVKRIRDRVAGLDVHRDNVVACCRIVEPDGTVEVEKASFATTRKGLTELSQFLLNAGVEAVAMESTGVYWRSPYYALEGVFPELWLCNAQHVKNVPGRKTDLSDAEWLADVAAHGMVRPSFVPPSEIREIREITRYRKTQIAERGREIQRLEKALQDAGVKVTSVASSVWSMSSREMIEALIAGERDPKVLAGMAKSRMRSKIDRLEEVLPGNFGPHHAIVCRQVIDHIEFLDRSIAALTEEITARLVPFEAKMRIITSVPGISTRTAEVIIAETGGDMSRFPSAAQLCAWAGTAPASHESAGKHKPVGTRKGSQHLKTVMIEAARAGSRTKGSYYSALYGRIARRRGPNKACVAVANSMLATIWHLLSNGQLYQDPGADYFTRRHDPRIEAQRLAKKIEELGFQVSISSTAA